MGKYAFIYAQVSPFSDSQSLKQQIDTLNKFALDNGIKIIEIFKGEAWKNDEPNLQLNNCLSLAEDLNIDYILVTELSKLGNTINSVIEIIDRMASKKINIYIQDLDIWTLNKVGEMTPLVLKILANISTFARISQENFKSRLSSGRESAKAKGIHMGRPSGSNMTPSQYIEKHNNVARYLMKGNTIEATAIACRTSMSTVQRVRKVLIAKNKI